MYEDDYNASLVSPDSEVTNPFSSAQTRPAPDNREQQHYDDRNRNDYRQNAPQQQPGPQQQQQRRRQPDPAPRRKPVRTSIGFLDFLTDRRFHVALGIFLILAATYLTVSAISYLNTAPEDQSEVISNTLDGIVADPDAEIENVGGPAGALASHYLITLGLGVGAFPLLIWMILCGISLLGLRKCKFWSMTFKALLFAVTLSLSIGFITYGLDITIPLGGFHGRYINTWLMERIGWIGTALVSILFIGFVAAVYFYDLLKIYQNYRKRVQAIKERMREAREAREAERRKVQEAMKASELGKEEDAKAAPKSPDATKIDLFTDIPEDIPPPPTQPITQIKTKKEPERPQATK
ncbi:MAG: DNA translocase FtsK 4TM domain-containing protein, partial [Muribaculaceae bacterium]|nr:DNA translocase FtsK 4TM domain-containing protein [Muribaculaceae bacterium]